MFEFLVRDILESTPWSYVGIKRTEPGLLMVILLFDCKVDDDYFWWKGGTQVFINFSLPCAKGFIRTTRLDSSMLWYDLKVSIHDISPLQRSCFRPQINAFKSQHRVTRRSPISRPSLKTGRGWDDIAWAISISELAFSNHIMCDDWPKVGISSFNWGTGFELRFPHYNRGF